MAYRDKFTFSVTDQFNLRNSSCAVCHNLCYSYNQSVATFSALILYSEQSQFYISNQSVSVLVTSFLRTVSDQTANVTLDQFYIPQQSFSLFVPLFLRTVSYHTANVTLNSNARYNHFLLITIHNSVYKLMFCFLQWKLQKANVKTPFSRYVKP